MFKYILYFLVVIINFYPSSVLAASYEADERDVQLSTRNFLVSNASYNELNRDRKGAITLCFKDQGNFNYEHTSLVFEVFRPNSPQDVHLCMVHYGRDDDCSGFGGVEKIMIDDPRNTIRKVYRARYFSISSGDSGYSPATFTRYASWFISNNLLLDGIKEAEKDMGEGKYSGNCVRYAAKIMRAVGLDVDFGWWTPKPSNLKLLADDYIKPKSNMKNFTKIPLN